MSSKHKKLLFARQAEILRAVAHPLRVEVLHFLTKGEQCVCDIAKAVGAERSNVSRHLSVMVAAGVLESRKDGLKVMYKIKTPCILKYLGCITNVVRAQAKENQRLLEAI
jgi:ArsR family transcriptional regulator